ncbi:MAG: cytidylate kinase family protein [Candidatus Aenigmarchaeota archaeon]|nr:cytidylate kinase family protein [Candidatus Aenigmarchaeota archaeon]
MIITISGLPGSGKTAVGKLLAERIGLKFYSIGDLRGKMAMERGLTIDQLNEIGMKEDWTDKKVDEYQKELGEREDNFVIDSWLGFHFVPHSIKIFLYVDLEVGAERIFRSQREDEEKKKTVEEIHEMIKKRVKQTDERYKKYYGIDFLDRSHYDMVIDTTNLAINQVIEEITKLV